MSRLRLTFAFALITSLAVLAGASPAVARSIRLKVPSFVVPPLSVPGAMPTTASVGLTPEYENSIRPSG